MKNPIRLLPILILGLPACAGWGPPRGDAGAVCQLQRVDAVNARTKAAPFVALIRTDLGMGTGFVIPTHDPSAMTVITNFHVIANTRSIQVDLPSAHGPAVSLANVQVVRVDPKTDLAVIQVPRIAAKGTGLPLAPAPVRAGEEVVILGFPYVDASSPTLTVERGDVTAVQRVVGETDYVQTNANVNPGNSGGPVLNACGQVVGVVVARMNRTERTNLIIPAERAWSLSQRTVGNPGDVKQAVEGQIEAFFSALEFGDGMEASTLVSRGFLDRTVAPVFSQELLRHSARLDELTELLRARGIRLDQLPPERQAAVLEAHFRPEELVTLNLALAMNQRAMDQTTATRLFFSMFVGEVFGRVVTHTTQRVKFSDRGARAIVEVRSDRGTKTWVLDLIQEWGIWQLETLTPA